MLLTEDLVRDMRQSLCSEFFRLACSSYILVFISKGTHEEFRSEAPRELKHNRFLHAFEEEDSSFPVMGADPNKEFHVYIWQERISFTN